MIGKKYYGLTLCLMVASVSLLARPAGVSAQPQPRQVITSPAQLMDAVNNLRRSNGLPALVEHSILMRSSQSQADYMAATGQVTHTRPGGITYTQQLLSLGFPLAGDLSLGGFRAENILSSNGPLVWDGIPPGWQDQDHMNTMLSQNFTHIGAGISQGADNRYYYALDCAASTSSGEMQDGASSILTSVPAGSDQTGVSQYMVPVVMSTSHPDGNVFHKVQYGQSLWSIAIMYGTTIKNIQALNFLGEDLIVYQGQELLVQKGATQPASATPTHVATPSPIFTSTSSMPTPVTPSISFPADLVPSPTITLIEAAQPSNTPDSRFLVGLLIVAAFVGGGVAVWLIRDPN